MRKAVVFDEAVDRGDDVAVSRDVVQRVRSIFFYPGIRSII
jgi:hypothetical protein